MKKILIVDDNPIICKIYRERFSQAGFQVEVAENGFLAMKALMSVRPDIVLLDLMMPIMHGVDVLRYVRATPELKATPVIILSEAYNSDLALEAAKIGAELTLLKSGCTPAILIDAVNKILSGEPLGMDLSQMLAVGHKKPEGG
ncbi:MAG TPA: response regulator [Verrucomicrobiae bacterium]|jgi:CheY-like chemotaxis protein